MTDVAEEEEIMASPSSPLEAPPDEGCEATSPAEPQSVRPRVHLPVVGQATTPPARIARSGAGDSALRFRLASLLRLTDKLVAKVVAAYDRLFELDDGEQAEIYLQMGRDLAREGRNEEALDALRKAARLQPGEGAAWLEIGLIQLRKGAAGAAVQSLRTAEQHGEQTFRLYRALADALAEQNAVTDAVAALGRAQELRPNDAAVAFRRGVLLDEAGRYDDAIVAFERAVELEPYDVSYRQSLGFALEGAGKRKAAIACFKEALDLEQKMESAE